MKHKEYIIPIGEEAKEFDEIFIGVIRKQPELIRCKDCRKHGDIGCPLWMHAVELVTDDNWFCADGDK